ncbi:Ger(x)C family spore germination protein [Paenibacillus sp. DYY-L-2]|uniref:Ger(x)C family spore germination protein n=1 Tax=Paenibacillus sp. DYY-L-2 TaxID=3447013 RepID=UPI003F50AEAE
MQKQNPCRFLIRSSYLRCLPLGLLILLVVTTGCWDRSEVEKLAIVAGLGIDLIPGPEPILLTAQIVNPSGLKKEGGGSSPPVLTLSSKGVSVTDAMRKFAEISPRRLFYGHTRVVIIGERMARAGLRPINDYLERAPELRRTFWMIVTPKTAKDILSASLGQENIPALGIVEMIQEFQHSSSAVVAQQKDFLATLTGKSGAAFASKLELVDEAAAGEEEDSGNPSNNSKNKNQLRLTGTAAFQTDKLAGYLSDAESRGLLWITGRLSGGTVVISCPDDKEDKISLFIERTKSKVTPVIRDGEIKININVDEEASISEITCKNMDISKPDTVKKLEDLQNKEIEERIMMTIKKCQTLKADILQFANAIHTRYPKLWKQKYEENWPEHFSKMEVSVTVKSKIRRVGMTSKSGKAIE